MKDLNGKVAVITGAGSGIGRGVALELATAGMHVVVSDIDEASAKSVADEVAALGVRSLAVTTDVGDRAVVESLADAAWSEFGAVHVLHNNAGFALFLLLESMSDADWRAILSTNLEGVVNGIQAFLPRMKTVEGEKHIVNTASMSGLIAGSPLGAYNATKFAVVALSETLRAEVERYDIGVSVLCPGVVSTNIIANSVRVRPGAAADVDAFGGGNVDASSLRVLTPEDVGRIVRRGIEDNELYIFTHPEFEVGVRARFQRILDAFERAAHQP